MVRWLLLMVMTDGATVQETLWKVTFVLTLYCKGCQIEGWGDWITLAGWFYYDLLQFTGVRLEGRISP